jgi:hypothetical protein
VKNTASLLSKLTEAEDLLSHIQDGHDLESFLW